MRCGMSRRFWGNTLVALGMLALLGAGVLALPELRQDPAPTWPALSPVSLATPPERDTPIVASATEALAAATPAASLPPATEPPTPISTAPATPLATPMDAAPSLAPSAMPTLMPSPTPTSVPPTGAGTPPPPRVVIPKIGVSAGIVEVSWQVVETNDGAVAEWEVAPPGLVGHHADSAQPGELGNVVLSAHGRDGAAFARLSELGIGDEVWLYAQEDRPLRYRVAEVVLLPEISASFDDRLEHARYLAPTEDQRLTLVTCWPSWAYTHRLIIIATPGGA